ncbi:MAG: LamG domain-containing protein [Pyrinomonadaceae bacterium]
MAAIFNAGTAGKCKPTATVAPSGQVAWFAGDGNANDIAGTNNGTLLNGAGFAVGRVSQSFSFDGVDDVVEIPDSPSFDFGTNEISVGAWIMPTTDSTLQLRGIIDQYNDQQATFLFALGSADVSGSRQGKFFVYGDSTGFVYKGIITITRIQPNTFTHVAAAYKQSTQEIKFYINGVETATTPEPGSVNLATIFNAALPVHIGRTSSATSAPFAGLIDEPSLYNRALTDAEITSIVSRNRRKT